MPVAELISGMLFYYPISNFFVIETVHPQRNDLLKRKVQHFRLATEGIGIGTGTYCDGTYVPIHIKMSCIFSRLDLEIDSELTRFLELHDSVLIEASDLATEQEEEEESGNIPILLFILLYRGPVLPLLSSSGSRFFGIRIQLINKGLIGSGTVFTP